MVMLYLVSYCAIRNPVCYPGFSICAPIFYLSFICDAYLLLRPGTVLFSVALLNMSRPVASDYPSIFAVLCILTLNFSLGLLLRRTRYSCHHLQGRRSVDKSILVVCMSVATETICFSSDCSRQPCLY
jgi:hypothetical protein